MAPYDKKLAALVLSRERPLIERLRLGGVHVPDQDKVKQMMEAIRLGLRPDASLFRMRIAVIRRHCTHRNAMWQHYDYDAFLKGLYDPRLLEDTGVHPTVQEDIRQVRVIEPDARIWVKALWDDPWPLVLFGQEVVYLRGWMGDKLLI